jgi:hypothetical protein
MKVSKVTLMKNYTVTIDFQAPGDLSAKIITREISNLLEQHLAYKLWISGPEPLEEKSRKSE